MRTFLRVLLVALALLAGFAIGWRAHERATFVPAADPRRFVPLPTDLAEILPSPSPIPGLHDYEQPTRYVAVTEGIPVPTATPAPRRRKASSSRTPSRAEAGHRQVRVGPDAIRGPARWHATGRDGFYAAAGCELRRYIRRTTGDDWRGTLVLVAFKRRAVEVRLNDAIGGCTRTLIDLSDEAFRQLAPLSVGVLRVAVDPR